MTTKRENRDNPGVLQGGHYYGQEFCRAGRHCPDRSTIGGSGANRDYRMSTYDNAPGRARHGNVDRWGVHGGRDPHDCRRPHGCGGKRFHAKETEKAEMKMLILITILLALIYVIAPKLALYLLVVAVCLWAVCLAITYLTFLAWVAVHGQRRGT
jgi:hypothetical protein